VLIGDLATAHNRLALGVRVTPLRKLLWQDKEQVLIREQHTLEGAYDPGLPA
jgi:hypothetical protein